jgi:hypothetical protein
VLASWSRRRLCAKCSSRQASSRHRSEHARRGELSFERRRRACSPATYLWSDGRVKGAVRGLRCVWVDGPLSCGGVEVLCCLPRGAQTYLGARSVVSGDVMVDGVAPRVGGRSFFQGCPRESGGSSRKAGAGRGSSAWWARARRGWIRLVRPRRVRPRRARAGCGGSSGRACARRRALLVGARGGLGR